MNSRLQRTTLALLACGAISVAHPAEATLVVNLTDNPLALAQAIFGSGITITGTPTLSSQPGQSGTFTGFDSGPYSQTGGSFGRYTIPSGVILSTGVASSATGTYTGGGSADLGGNGSPVLSALSGTPTFDAVVLTTQFTSANPTVFLNYAFASAEYPASIGSFGDPFAIFVNGTNVALVPGTTVPVSINSVNAGVNSSFFTQYSDPTTPFNYGGITTLLTASANVSTTAVNTIQFTIADAVDGNVDSAVLIQGGSSTSVPEPVGLLLLATGLALLGGCTAARGKAQA